MKRQPRRTSFGAGRQSASCYHETGDRVLVYHIIPIIIDSAPRGRSDDHGGKHLLLVTRLSKLHGKPSATSDCLLPSGARAQLVLRSAVLADTVQPARPGSSLPLLTCETNDGATGLSKKPRAIFFT